MTIKDIPRKSLYLKERFFILKYGTNNFKDGGAIVKPLNKLVRENKYFSGSTIIGSGEVVLILDVTNLILTKREFAVVD